MQIAIGTPFTGDINRHGLMVWIYALTFKQFVFSSVFFFLPNDFVMKDLIDEQSE